MRGRFYPPPPVFVGGRQPYAPRLLTPESGEVPNQPPVRTLVTLGIIFASWLQPAQALPRQTRIAPFVAAEAAATNPPYTRNAIRVIDASWRNQPWTVIYVCRIAPQLETPTTPDNPPARSDVNQRVLLGQWQVLHRPLPSAIKVAPLLLAAVVPDNPPQRSDVNRNVILRQWAPSQIHYQRRVFLREAASSGALVDTGLVVRYYLDEAASGSTPTQALDTSGVGSAFNLTLDYGASAEMSYTEVSGNRGLDSTATEGTQGARGTVNDVSDKVRDALHGVTQATIEVVYDADVFGLNGSRIVSLMGASATFGVHGNPTLPDNHLRLFVNGVEAIRTLTGMTGARKVLHMVLDTPQVTASDRLKLYLDGTQVTSFNTTTYPAQNTTLSLSASTVVMVAGQGTGSRNINGRVFYAAIYAHALTAPEVSGNYNILALDDDAPAAEDTTPDQFSFTDQSGVALSSTITSAAITVTAIDAASAITVSGGTYDINGSGSFTASAGTVNVGDTVRARHTSSASYLTATNTVITIGGVSDTFTSTTAIDPADITHATNDRLHFGFGFRF